MKCGTYGRYDAVQHSVSHFVHYVDVRTLFDPSSPPANKPYMLPANEKTDRSSATDKVGKIMDTDFPALQGAVEAAASVMGDASVPGVPSVLSALAIILEKIKVCVRPLVLAVAAASGLTWKSSLLERTWRTPTT